MADAEIPVIWKFSQSGGERVKFALDQLNKAWEAGALTQEQAQKSLRKITTEASRAANAHRYYKNILLATNPALLTFTRSLSVAGRAARSVLSVTNALNLATIAMQGSTENLDQALLDAELAAFRYAQALESGDPNAIAEAQNELAKALNEVKRANEEATKQQVQNWITFGATAIFTASSLTSALLDLKGEYARAVAGGGRFAASLGLIGASVPYIAIGLLIGLLGVFTSKIAQEYNPAFKEFRDQLAVDLGDTWITDLAAQLAYIPFITANSLNPAIQSWEDFKNAIFNITGEISNIIGGFIDLFILRIDTMIEAINRISFGAINIPLIPLVPKSETHRPVGEEERKIQEQKDLIAKNAPTFENISKGGSSLGSPIPPPVPKTQLGEFGDITTKVLEDMKNDVLKALGGSAFTPEQQAEFDKLTKFLEENSKTATDGTKQTEENTESIDAMEKTNKFLSDITQISAEKVAENTDLLDVSNDVIIKNTEATDALAEVLSGGLGGTTTGTGGNSNQSSLGPAYDPNRTKNAQDAGKASPDPNRGGTKRPTVPKSTKAFASGGIINEPMVGMGLNSGIQYMMGESGPEMIVPLGGQQPAPAVTKAFTDSHNSQNSTTIVNIKAAGSILSERDLMKLFDDYLKRALKGRAFG